MISFEQPKTVSSAKKVEDIEIFDLNGEKLSFENQLQKDQILLVITYKKTKTSIHCKKAEKSVI